MKEITIMVSGPSNTGKSTLMLELEKLLKDNGYNNVELIFDEPDYTKEIEYWFRIKHASKQGVVDELKNNSLITLKEKRL